MIFCDVLSDSCIARGSVTRWYPTLNLVFIYELSILQ